jgi:hypothetical protein
MNANWVMRLHSVEVPCTIEVEHTSESLHAHVELMADMDVEPGDEVIVHGPPIYVPFGEKALLHRLATITRASRLKRAWTRVISKFELTELYEVSFSSWRRL